MVEPRVFKIQTVRPVWVDFWESEFFDWYWSVCWAGR